MGGKKAGTAASAARIDGRWRRAGNMLAGRGRWLAIGLAVAVAFAGLWYAAWQRVRGHVLSGNEYVVNPRDIEISPPPAWIHADIKAEVIRDASLGAALSVLDPDLTLRVKQAFQLHPWVAEVQRVSKRHPAAVQVELTYRKPLAMVEVPRGLLPVDAAGILLPSDDFSPSEAKNYPRVAGIQTVPAGPVGSRWHDPRVSGALQIISVLETRWQDLKLYRVVPSPQPAGGRYSDDYTYDLVTQGGTRFRT